MELLLPFVLAALLTYAVTCMGKERRPGMRFAFGVWLLYAVVSSCGGFILTPPILLPLFLIGGWILRRHNRRVPEKATPLWALTYVEIEKRHKENLRVIELAKLPPDRKQAMREDAEAARQERLNQLIEKNMQ